MKTAALVMVSVAAGIILLYQQSEIARLKREGAELRQQLAQTTSLQEDNSRLREQLKNALESGQTNAIELARLRGQAVRLRQVKQENDQLKNQRQQLEQQLGEARSAASAQNAQEIARNTAPPAATDLGSLELVDGVPVQFDLGGGTNCIVSPKALADGSVTMNLMMSTNNPDGTAMELGRARISARAGQYCTISVGDRTIGLAVNIKTQ